MTSITDFNADAKRIEIPFSKPKLIKLLLIAACFCAVGFQFVTDPSAFTDNGLYHRPRLEIIIVGIITMGFLGFGGISVAIAELFNKRPGLIIDDNGITIFGLFSSSNIKWCDISKFDVVSISRTSLISIFLNDTSGYIQRQKNVWKRKVMSFSYKRYGAPLSITTNALKCDFDELLDLLNTRLADYKRAEKVTSFKGDLS